MCIHIIRVIVGVSSFRSVFWQKKKENEHQFEQTMCREKSMFTL